MLKLDLINNRKIELDDDEFQIVSSPSEHMILLDLPGGIKTREIISAKFEECEYSQIKRIGDQFVVFQKKVCLL